MAPEHERAPLFVITGIQAAGKTTIGRSLAMRFDRGVFIEGDAVRGMVVTGRVEMTPDPPPEALAQLMMRYRAQAALARMHHDVGFAVVVEDVILGPHLDTYLAMLADRPVHLVVLVPDPDVVAAREYRRGKLAYDDTWSVTELNRVLREGTPRKGMWLDSSHMSVQDTVETILAKRSDALIREPSDDKGAP